MIRGLGDPARPVQETDHDDQDQRPRPRRLPLQPLHLQELRLQLTLAALSRPGAGEGAPSGRGSRHGRHDHRQARPGRRSRRSRRSATISAAACSPPARAGAVRRYGAGDVRRLLFIRRAQAAGFTLEAIGELLALDSSHDRARVRALAGERLAALEAKIAELEAARSALTRLSKACAAGDGGALPDPGGFRSLAYPRSVDLVL